MGSASMPTSRWPRRRSTPRGSSSRVLVVNLDAHQGDGTAATIHPWPWASILDVYEDDLFPAIKQPEDFPIPIPAGLGGSEYLGIVEESLPRALDDVQPDLLIYNAGSDPFVEDPLTRLRLSRDDLARRDLLVATMARERGIRWRWSSRAGMPGNRGASTPTASRRSWRVSTRASGAARSAGLRGSPRSEGAREGQWLCEKWLAATHRGAYRAYYAKGILKWIESNDTERSSSG